MWYGGWTAVVAGTQGSLALAKFGLPEAEVQRLARDDAFLGQALGRAPTVVYRSVRSVQLPWDPSALSARGRSVYHDSPLPH